MKIIFYTLVMLVSINANSETNATVEAAISERVSEGLYHGTWTDENGLSQFCTILFRKSRLSKRFEFLTSRRRIMADENFGCGIWGVVENPREWTWAVSTSKSELKVVMSEEQSSIGNKIVVRIKTKSQNHLDVHFVHLDAYNMNCSIDLRNRIPLSRKQLDAFSNYELDHLHD